MKTDGLTETLAAPKRDKPGALPEIGRIARLRKRHVELQEELAKASARRDDAVHLLCRAHARVRKAREALVRSAKRLNDERKLAAKPNTMHDDKI